MNIKYQFCAIALVLSIGVVRADEPIKLSPKSKQNENIVTKVGVYKRFDDKLMVKVYEQDGKLNYRVYHNDPEGLAGEGPTKPAIAKGSNWFIFSEVSDEVWIYDGGDVLILRPFHERRPEFQNGGIHQIGAGKKDLARMPKAVSDRLPESFKAKFRDESL